MREMDKNAVNSWNDQLIETINKLESECAAKDARIKELELLLNNWIYEMASRADKSLIERTERLISTPKDKQP